MYMYMLRAEQRAFVEVFIFRFFYLASCHHLSKDRFSSVPRNVHWTTEVLVVICHGPRYHSGFESTCGFKCCEIDPNLKCCEIDPTTLYEE